jgi:hypothetical protein
MNDPHISYANVRRINTPAYKLLIVVAAIIQIVNISDELSTKIREVEEKRSRVERTGSLLRAVGGPRRKVLVEEEEEKPEPPSRADTDVTFVQDDGLEINEEDFDAGSVFDDDGMDFEMEEQEQGHEYIDGVDMDS